MAYVVQGGRVVSVKREPTTRQIVREHKKKFGVDPQHLVALMKLDVGLAERVLAVVNAVQDPSFQRRNPTHNRHKRRQYGLSHRQYSRDERAYNRVMATASRSFYDKPFDDIEFADEGRACFGGRC